MNANPGATLESLPPACEAVLSAHVRKLTGEPLDDAEAARIDAHRGQCAVCRELLHEAEYADGVLRAALRSARPGPGFAARTMAALPSQPELRVFAGRRSRFWRHAGIAAGIAVAAGVAIVFALTSNQPAFAIQRGALVDTQGRALKSIPENTVCTAQEDTLIRGAHAELLNVRKGARFQFATTTSKDHGPVLGLASGDVYAAATAKPVRMDCPHFEAELSSGNCFLTHEASAMPQSVMILFAGDARVSPHARASVPLHSGQVYVCVGSAEDSFSETLELSRATALADQPATPAPNDTVLRRKYEQMVSDYRAELAALNSRIAANDSPELRDRSARIAQYLEAHEARLKTMRASDRPEHVPAEAIESIKRGVKSHTEPGTWM